MKKTKTQFNIVHVVIAFCFGVLFVTSMVVANHDTPRAQAVYIYAEPSAQTH